MTHNSTDWPEVALGDVMTIKHGYAFKSKHFTDQGDYIVVTPGNFYDEGGFKSKEPEKYYDGPVKSEYILERGDLLVVMTEQKRGLLGSAGLVPLGGVYLHNQRLGRAGDIDTDRFDKRFGYYLFNTKGVRDQIQATANGVKVRHTSPSRLSEVRLPLPSLDAQRKIAAVLAAYDELIENNLRRIEILEQMAQAIYREWFVNFRFGDLEEVEVVESPLGAIPRGWAVGRLGDLVKNVRDSTKAGKHLEQMPYVPIDCIERESMTIRETRPGSEAKSSLLLFNEGDILFGAMRPYFHKVGVAPANGVTRSTCFVLRTFDSAMYHYALLTIFQEPTIAYATNHSTGSTIPYARWEGVMSEMPVLLPPRDLANRFGQTVESKLHLARALVRQSSNLRATRDLLLPKLISGEIDVSDFDIDSAWLAA